jgi:Protein of unknown function (DUF2786)
MNAAPAPELLDRIRKLRTLASGNTNEHEAAAAAAKAAKLIAEHGIAEAMLEVEPEPIAPGAVGDPVDVMGKRFYHWRSYLLSNLCDLHGCAHAYTSQTKAVFFGRPPDVAIVQELFAWLASEIDTLARRQEGKSKKWLEEYRLGCVRGIGDAMLEAQSEARRLAPSTALAMLDDRLASAKDACYTATRRGKRIRNRKEDEDEGEAFTRGAEDGWKVQKRGRS